MNDNFSSERLIQITQQAKLRKDRYETLNFAFDKQSTWFLPVRHFNSDTPITPGAWKEMPYNIAVKPINPCSMVRNSEPILLGGGYFLWHRKNGEKKRQRDCN